MTLFLVAVISIDFGTATLLEECPEVRDLDRVECNIGLHNVLHRSCITICFSQKQRFNEECITERSLMDTSVKDGS